MVMGLRSLINFIEGLRYSLVPCNSLIFVIVDHNETADKYLERGGISGSYSTTK